MKKMITNITLFLFGLFLGTCVFSFFVGSKKEKAIKHPKYVSVDAVKRNVLLKGSVTDYCDLKEIFSKVSNPEEILYYSVIMANKYNYVPANYDVYKELKQFFVRNNLGEFDPETKQLAESYLEYGAKHGDSIAKSVYDKLKR